MKILKHIRQWHRLAEPNDFDQELAFLTYKLTFISSPEQDNFKQAWRKSWRIVDRRKLLTKASRDLLRMYNQHIIMRDEYMHLMRQVSFYSLLSRFNIPLYSYIQYQLYKCTH